MFEYDPVKSEANLAKHGIDFETAQLIWQDNGRTESVARSDDEIRIRTTGMIDGKLWSAFFTVRGERVRIISVRRARDIEERDYHEREELERD